MANRLTRAKAEELDAGDLLVVSCLVESDDETTSSIAPRLLGPKKVERLREEEIQDESQEVIVEYWKDAPTSIVLRRIECHVFDMQAPINMLRHRDEDPLLRPTAKKGRLRRPTRTIVEQEQQEVIQSHLNKEPRRCAEPSIKKEEMWPVIEGPLADFVEEYSRFEDDSGVLLKLGSPTSTPVADDHVPEVYGQYSISFRRGLQKLETEPKEQRSPTCDSGFASAQSTPVPLTPSPVQPREFVLRQDTAPDSLVDATNDETEASANDEELSKKSSIRLVATTNPDCGSEKVVEGCSVSYEGESDNEATRGNLGHDDENWRQLRGDRCQQWVYGGPDTKSAATLLWHGILKRKRKPETGQPDAANEAQNKSKRRCFGDDQEEKIDWRQRYDFKQTLIPAAVRQPAALASLINAGDTSQISRAHCGCAHDDCHTLADVLAASQASRRAQVSALTATSKRSARQKLLSERADLAKRRKGLRGMVEVDDDGVECPDASWQRRQQRNRRRRKEGSSKRKAKEHASESHTSAAGGPFASKRRTGGDRRRKKRRSNKHPTVVV